MIKNFFDTNNIEYKENYSLKNLNTYKIECIAKFLVYPKNLFELQSIISLINENNIPYFILGNGSNIILSMDYYDGIVIKLDRFNNVEYKENYVTVGAGYSLIKLSIETAEKGLSGLEFASGIPGNVGASTAMNAGAYKEDMSCVIDHIKVLKNNSEIITLTNKELNYSYRNSLLKNNKNYIVLETTFKLKKGNVEEMKQLINERRIKRNSSQPLNYPSAGSVFRNPDNMYAGELIEKSNLKGYNIGGAEISEKHANFIINKGHATGSEIIELINLIKKEVKKKYNIDLILEQIIIE